MKKIKGNLNKKIKTNNFTKLTRGGISLIVLIITIIVIIILAAAIILTLNNNNPIMEANKARYESDCANMQAIFTNAVAKVMAKNQATVSVSAGQINTITGGVKETDGQVAYTLTDAQNAANSTGTIIFAKGTNSDTTFYTGKQLPIYPAGETKWYVDKEGNISLEVAGTKYGNGEEILDTDNDNNEETDVPKTPTATYDVSEAQDGSVMAYVVERDGETDKYDLLVLGKGILKNNTEDNEPEYEEYMEKIVSIKVEEGVTELYSRAFYGCSEVTSIELPSTVTSVGSNSFYKCSNLTTMTIPDSVTSMGSHAFYNCSKLTTINLSNSLTSIEGNTFNGCNALSNITIPDTVTSIGTFSFSGCNSLTTIVIPKSVTNIASRAFYNANGLENVYFEHINVPTFNKSCFYKNSTDVICTFYFKNITVANAFISGTHYNADAGTKSSDYGWTINK